MNYMRGRSKRISKTFAIDPDDAKYIADICKKTPAKDGINVISQSEALHRIIEDHRKGKGTRSAQARP